MTSPKTRTPPTSRIVQNAENRIRSLARLPIPLCWKYQPLPQLAQVVGEQAQPSPHFIRPEPVAAQPRHLHRLLGFFDPLLRRAPFIIEPHHGPARRGQVSHNETGPREQLPKWNSTFATTRRVVFRQLLSLLCLVGKACGGLPAFNFSDACPFQASEGGDLPCPPKCPQVLSLESVGSVRALRRWPRRPSRSHADRDATNRYRSFR